MIRIAIADKEELFVQLLEGFLEKQTCIECLFTASSGKELLDKIAQITSKPHLILLDFKMKDMEAAMIIKKVRHISPDTKYAMVSANYKKTFTGHLMKIGASAFVSKGISTAHLLDVIKSVHFKGYYFMEEQIDVLRSQIRPTTPKPKFLEKEEFTEREKEILLLLCAQYTAQEIADKLFISRRTVEGHKDNLFAKTGARNLAGLVIYAMQNQLIAPNYSPVFY